MKDIEKGEDVKDVKPSNQTNGYLPHESPGPWGLVSLGFQHVITMFPATVLVAILTKFDIGVTLFASGLATVVSLIGSGLKIPMYYGSSFAYIAAIGMVVSAKWGGMRVAQVGIVATAFVSIIAGIIIRKVGKHALDKVLPPIITGSVAIVIGISLTKAALDMAGAHWEVAMITLISTVLFSVYLRNKGFLGMIPILLGAAVGYLASLGYKIVDFKPVADAAWFAVPAFSFPDFGNPNALKAVLAIAPIAIATIPESTAHLYQISLYIDKVAEDMGKKKPNISKMIGLNLILDGIGDFINGMLGGCAGTNYGENNSLMAITRNYSSKVLVTAGFIAMILAFIGKLAALVGTLPVAVTGGLAIYLFGVIGLQGAALMISEAVNLFDPKELAIGAIILTFGIGGSMLPGGVIKAFGVEWPAIATSAMLGILLNLVFVLFPQEKISKKSPQEAML